MSPRSGPDDPYCYPGTNVLRNRLDIRDPNPLEAQEARAFAAGRILLASTPPPATFGVARLQEIHRICFGPVYEWAGEFRTVGMTRAGQPPFCLPEFIRPQLDQIFSALHREGFLRDCSLSEFARRAGHYLGEINAVHPFREGNGRTQRQLIAELARSAGYGISWGTIRRDEMARASVASFLHGDSQPLADLLLRALKPLI